MMANTPVTGLFFLPLPTNAPVVGPILTSHITRKYLTTATPLPPYNFDHRLCFDTPSLLPVQPGVTTPRRYTQFLTLSHLPGRTYVGTSASAAKPDTPANPALMTIVTVPSTLPDESLPWLVSQKMQPLWASRSRVQVNNGAAFTIGAGGEWRLRIGDLRITGGQGVGRVRGMVAEVEFLGDEVEDGGEEQVDWDGRETLLRSFWEAVAGSSGVSMDGLKYVGKVPGVEGEGQGDLVLVRQYMDLLKFARP